MRFSKQLYIIIRYFNIEVIGLRSVSLAVCEGIDDCNGLVLQSYDTRELVFCSMIQA